MDGRSISFGVAPRQIDKLLAWPLGDKRKRGLMAPTRESVKTHEGQIGRYRLLRILGEGGMGTVYLAERNDATRRKVALKVIKPRMDFLHVQIRFEMEWRALARSKHRNVAQALDMGCTSIGQPFFAMEYVRGLCITKHCDHWRLTIPQRLALFLQICNAMHHVHGKGILHRDIKPSNILVSLESDPAIPKIIDFGAAKITALPTTERTLSTQDIPVLGTPEYMSPEQIRMDEDDIDPRSDVYSLGVLLYVLLAGVFPHDPTPHRGDELAHLPGTTSQIAPPRPSMRLRALGKKAQQIAKNRSTNTSTLIANLGQDLEWIPLKAMRAKRSERYNSASELADDIDNYLRGDPLLAEQLTP